MLTGKKNIFTSFAKNKKNRGRVLSLVSKMGYLYRAFEAFMRIKMHTASRRNARGRKNPVLKEADPVFCICTSFETNSRWLVGYQ